MPLDMKTQHHLQSIRHAFIAKDYSKANTLFNKMYDEFCGPHIELDKSGLAGTNIDALRCNVILFTEDGESICLPMDKIYEDLQERFLDDIREGVLKLGDKMTTLISELDL